MYCFTKLEFAKFVDVLYQPKRTVLGLEEKKLLRIFKSKLYIKRSSDIVNRENLYVHLTKQK